MAGMSEYDEMTDEEFSELTDKLFRFALEEGDLGYQYWSRAIRKLKHMRGQAMKAARDVTPPLHPGLE